MNKIKCIAMVTRLACCGVLALCGTAISAQTHSASHVHEQHKESHSVEARSEMRRLAIPDVEILNQDGEKQKLYTDLVKGKIVVINFVYTTCTAVCPLSGDNFARLQTVLGDRMGKDVHLLSITTDPETDSPAKLKAWSERFRPKTGWTFVTGDKAAMGTLLLALIGEGPRRGFHTPIALVVDDQSGAWKRTYGLEPPAKFLELLERLSAQAKQ